MLPAEVLPTDDELAAWDWRAALKDQGRTMTWLGRATDKAQSTVYGYAYGQRPAPIEWLRDVARLLGKVAAA